MSSLHDQNLQGITGDDGTEKKHTITTQHNWPMSSLRSCRQVTRISRASRAMLASLVGMAVWWAHTPACRLWQSLSLLVLAELPETQKTHMTRPSRLGCWTCLVAIPVVVNTGTRQQTDCSCLWQQLPGFTTMTSQTRPGRKLPWTSGQVQHT